MNTVWSTYIQRIGTLYESRRLRFSDDFRDSYQSSFKFAEGSRILDVGCGPGALAEALHRWYPKADIYGVDRDSNFIAFAKRHSSDITYAEGDAVCLPFEKDCFDVTISNTVAEHVEPSKFYGEQYRVLKNGGTCVVLSARKGVTVTAPCIAEESEWERQLWSRLAPYHKEIVEKYAVCAYPQTEAELPLCMEKYGFQEVTVDYITVHLTPDHPACSKEMAYAMINANRRNALDNIERLSQIAAREVAQEELEELKRLVNKKYDRRLSLYDAGIKQWDTDLSVTMVVRGTKSGCYA